MIAVIDTETSHLPDYKNLYDLSKQPHVIQLAFQIADDDGNVKMEFETLIKPNGWTIDPGAQAVHGISIEECEKYGIDIKNALAILNLYCRPNPIFVAHNLPFDDMLLGFEFQRLGKESCLDKLEKFCTMKNSRDIVKAPKTKGFGFKNPKLQESYRYFFGKEFDGAHRAIFDTRACSEVYFAIKKHLAANPTE